MVSMMVIGPGRVNLSLRLVCALAIATVHRAAPPQRTYDRRTVRLVAIVANAHPHFTGEVDAVELLQEAVDEMLT